jgi:hypothetical protein
MSPSCPQFQSGISMRGNILINSVQNSFVDVIIEDLTTGLKLLPLITCKKRN